MRSQIAPPPSVPGAKKKVDVPIPKAQDPIEDITENEIKPPATEEQSVEHPPPLENQKTISKQKEDEGILQEQILGDSSSKDNDLDKKPVAAEKTVDKKDEGKSLKAREIIQNNCSRRGKNTEENSGKTKRSPKEATEEVQE